MYADKFYPGIPLVEELLDRQTLYCWYKTMRKKRDMFPRKPI